MGYRTEKILKFQRKYSKDFQLLKTSENTDAKDFCTIVNLVVNGLLDITESPNEFVQMAIDTTLSAYERILDGTLEAIKGR